MSYRLDDLDQLGPGARQVAVDLASHPAGHLSLAEAEQRLVDALKLGPACSVEETLSLSIEILRETESFHGQPPHKRFRSLIPGTREHRWRRSLRRRIRALDQLQTMRGKP